MPASLVSAFTASALASVLVAPPQAQCTRSADADWAADLFGEAEDLRYEATTAMQHAEAARRYDEAARAIPFAELAWTQGTKYVTRAHEEYLVAASDTAVPIEERRAWLLSDQALLETYVMAADKAEASDDPCRDDPTTARAHLQGVTVMLAGLGDDAPTAEPMTPPGPAGPDPSPPRDEPRPAAPPGRGLVIGGGVMLGLAAAGAVIMTVGLVRAHSAAEALPDADPGERGPIFRAGAQGNAMSVAGIAVLGTGVVLGTSLLAVGLVKKGRSDRRAAASVVPSRAGALLVLEGRF